MPVHHSPDDHGDPTPPSPVRVRVAAVDLGASSGRVMAGTVSLDRLDMTQVHRFVTPRVSGLVSLRWDVGELYRNILLGLRLAGEQEQLDGVGIDSWAVDYGLFDEGGELLEDPWCYRDSRTRGMRDRAELIVPAAEQFDTTGVAQLSFNTVYQLMAARGSAALDAASTLLLLPDLFGYWLTGQIGAERTNASTTGLYDLAERSWANHMAHRLGVPVQILPPLRDPGDIIGDLLPEVRTDVGVEATVIAVGSHDTASAVVATPLEHRDAAYLSSGTWSLIGLELDKPVLTEESRLAGFTNEAGVDGTVRFLTNVMGLWVLSECLRWWPDASLDDLLAMAAAARPLRTVIDIDDPWLMRPGDMTARIRTLAEDAGEPRPVTRVQVVRCVLDSLALAYRRTLRAAGDLAGRHPSILHIVGGGSQNQALCQLTADACELPVLAGPVEASALGNVLVQARALGVDVPDLAAMRDLVRRTHRLIRYEPSDSLNWSAAEARLPAAKGR